MPSRIIEAAGGGVDAPRLVDRQHAVAIGGARRQLEAVERVLVDEFLAERPTIGGAQARRRRCGRRPGRPRARLPRPGLRFVFCVRFASSAFLHVGARQGGGRHVEQSSKVRSTLAAARTA